MIGKKVRLNRLFKHSKRTFIVPMDHGVNVGPIAGLQDMEYVVKRVARGGADGIVIHKGLVRQIAEYLSPEGCELIVQLSASTIMSPFPNQKELVSSVEDAIRLGATAVSVCVNLGDGNDARMLKDFGCIAEKCDLWGMPLLAMMAVTGGTTESEYNPAKIKHAARVAEEIGADIVKVNYTGSVETFSQITDAVKIPVIITGGPRMDSIYDLLVMISEATLAGAKGVALGRNVFQYHKPRVLAGKVRRVIDEVLSGDKIKELADLLT